MYLLSKVRVCLLLSLSNVLFTSIFVIICRVGEETVLLIRRPFLISYYGTNTYYPPPREYRHNLRQRVQRSYNFYF